MNEIEYLKKRIGLIDNLFNNEIYKSYEELEEKLLRQTDYKEYYLVKHGLKNDDELRQYYDNILSGNDLNLYPTLISSADIYATLTSPAASIRAQYEADKKKLTELENGNN